MEEKWQMTSVSALSIPSSKDRLADGKKFHLRLKEPKPLPKLEPQIPTTKLQRLAYFRAYACSMYKSELLTPKYRVRANGMFWMCIFNAFFKNLPQGFVHLMLASYSPQHHLFLDKMVPIFYGTQFWCIITSTIELLVHADTIILILDYIFLGLYYKYPWNSCIDSSFVDVEKNLTVFCYNISEFKLKVAEGASCVDDFFKSNNNESFIIAQIDYYRRHGLKNSGDFLRSSIFFLLVWSLIALYQQWAVSLRFWKVFNFTHWTTNVVYFAIFIYLEISGVLSDYNRSAQAVFAVYLNDLQNIKNILKSDLHILTESITTPPVVHVLTARSNQQIQPSWDSSWMTISDGLFFITTEVVRRMTNDYCERTLGVELYFPDIGDSSFFYIWPIFFSNFLFGNMFSLMFFLIIFFMEFLTAIVTCRCLGEVVMAEIQQYKHIKRWMFTSAFMVLGIIIFSSTNFKQRLILFIYGKSFGTVTEAIVIFLIYPTKRLLDDFTFHYGIPPSKMIILILKFVPIYYSIKIYFVLISVVEIATESITDNRVPFHFWSWSLYIIPLVIGAIYVIVKYSMKYTRPITLLFNPLPIWGPIDYKTRQLRKLYDSRTYIKSEADKALSKYFMSKTDSKVYQIDISYPYEYHKRSITRPLVEARFHQVKKKMN